MDTLHVFLWAAGGSVAFEIVGCVETWQRRGRPLRCHLKFGYWLSRLLLAVFAGALAVAHHVETPLLALNIGVAAPLIIRTFARTPLSKGL